MGADLAFSYVTGGEWAGTSWISLRLDAHDDRGAHNNATPRRSAVDADLVARIQHGDVAAFETMYRAHASGMAAFANGFVRAPDIAEELVADVFVRVWARRETFDPAAGIRAYLYAAVRRRALNHLRGDRRAEAQYHTLAVLTESRAIPSADTRVEYDEMFAAVQRVIAGFPAMRRQAMDLRWGQGLSNAEIAEVLGVTDQAVRSHLSRALRDLRAAFPALLEE